MDHDDILTYLIDRAGSWVSGEEMASHLRVSRTAVWKQVQHLRTLGYDIASSTNKGYCLEERPDLLDPEIIRFGLNTKRLGQKILCYKEVGSTNELAGSIARSSDDGTVVLSETQSEGRGRLERMWHSPAGGVWMSLILKQRIPLDQVPRINMAVGVALARAFMDLYGLKAGIKWPNDLLINDRKLCGILMEISLETNELEHAVIGIGINANVDLELYLPEWNATSLAKEIGHKVSRVELVQKILEEIEKALEDVTSEEISEEWRRRSATLGRYVKIASRTGDIYGEAVSLLDDGSLSIRLADGQMQRILAGDCIHLRDCKPQMPYGTGMVNLKL
ncbi:MAG TPA: biotin--[acetyl-CoA-carboxylase] ligase [Methanotrichaceae archaeon]|nr:biotin--[acetyl-CoA-carboxylase] ligase [Methanotrichaceae archaeon]